MSTFPKFPPPLPTAPSDRRPFGRRKSHSREISTKKGMSFRPSVASGEISPEPLQIHFYHSLSVAVAMRCLGNARSCYYRAQPYRRAARHDMGVGLAVRSPASTLRRTGSKSLKHRTREEGAGKGEFAFTECRNFYYSLAQNRGFCAKEEPQAIEQTSRVYSACCEVSLAATRRNLPGYVSDTIYPYYSLPFAWGGVRARERSDGEVDILYFYRYGNIFRAARICGRRIVCLKDKMVI